MRKTHFKMCKQPYSIGFNEKAPYEMKGKFGFQFKCTDKHKHKNI